MAWRPVGVMIPLVVAFGLGALVTYGITQRPEKWGVIVATSHYGANLWGLFETSEECLTARSAFRDDYASSLQRVGTLKKGDRTLLLDTGTERINVTFTCLKLSEIRGLALTPEGAGATR